LVELIEINLNLKEELDKFEFFFLKGMKLWSFEFCIKFWGLGDPNYEWTQDFAIKKFQRIVELI
jgi:hypothetical protein